MRGLIAAAGVLAALGATAPAAAAERGWTMPSFSRLRVSGPITADVRVGTGTIVRATGDAGALDRLTVRVENGTLVIRPDASAGRWPPGSRVTMRIATPDLTRAALDGSGSIAIDRVRGDRFDAAVAGSGGMRIARAEVERVGATLSGSGGLAIAGRAAFVRASVEGSGDLDAGALNAGEVDLALAGSGSATMAATRSARVVASGSGDATIAGDPACTVRHTGSGEVVCGRGR